MNNTLYWVASTYLAGIGPVRLKKGLENFDGDIKKFFSAQASELTKSINLKKIENDLAWCEKNNCHVLTWEDQRYPKLLAEISAPPVLYALGDVELLNQAQIAMVGTRHPTASGIETAEQFAYALTEAGLVVTSGLALGIDTASHGGALAANGKTIAVMGTGLKHIYPKSNDELAQKISKQGVLVSEFPLETAPKPSNFPLRNRLISGLSLGVLVVEAAVKSGSLITARFAAEQGREVFAIPSSIHHPLAKGCHQLIRQGAKLVENVEDILVELAPLRDTLCKPLPKPTVLKADLAGDLDDIQKQLLTQIGYESTAFNTIVIRSGLTSGEVSSILLSLELKGYVDTVLGGYCRRH